MDNYIKTLGIEIDTALDQGDSSKLIKLGSKCVTKLNKESGQNRVILRFYEANCYGALTRIKRQSEGFDFSWNLNEQVAEVLALRKAISEDAFLECNPIFQCKIYTNIGNSYSQLGRIVEAIKYWEEALKITPNFAMALGAKGNGIVDYAHYLYDQNHAAIFTAMANEVLKESISKGVLWDSGEHPEAEAIFQKNLDYTSNILERIGYNYDLDLDEHPLGETDEEVDFRAWCLSLRLFLCPLNDISRVTAAAHDPLHLPNHKYDIGEDARFPKYYNVLKQEYVMARYMLYEALKGDQKHIADKDILLLSGLDGAYFGYRTEQLKTAYRLAYSLFDKIAVFINEYFSVGVNERQIYFRSIWSKYDKEEKRHQVRAVFEKSKNLPLRGLYYLSKDIYEEKFKDSSLPDAQELASLRNATEHRFLIIQEYPAQVEGAKICSYITKDDFEKKTLRIISMAREALIYLSLAMHREESIREENQGSDQARLSIPIYSEPIKRDY